MGREALLEAAAELLGEATLAEVGSFLSARRVAARAGVSVGTVTHHFPGGAGRPRSLVDAAVVHAIVTEAESVAERTRADLEQAVVGLRAGDEDSLRRLAEIAGQDLAGYSAGSPSATAALLVAAVGPGDPHAASALADFYEASLEPLPRIYEQVAEAMGRRFGSTLGPKELTEVLSALVDGLAMRQRLRPDPARTQLFTNAVLALFLAATSEGSTEDDPSSALTDLLMGESSTSTLDPHKRAAMVDATMRLYREGGWDAVTMSAVARAAQVNRATVTAHFADRGGLAAAVMAQLFPAVNAGIARDLEAGLPIDQLVWRYVQGSIELSRQHRPVSAAVTSAIVSRALLDGPPDPSKQNDPRAVAPLTTALARAIYARRHELAPGVVEDETDAFVLSGVIHVATIPLVLRRETYSTADVADYVVRRVLRGVFSS